MFTHVPPMLIAFLVLSCPFIQAAVLSTPKAPTASESVTEQEGGNAPVSGLPPQPEIETTKSGELKQGCMSFCEKTCDENNDMDCKFIGDQIPVMCDGKSKECKAACSEKCDCQAACGCQSYGGCEDECSKACSMEVENVVGSVDGEEEEEDTTLPPQPEGSVIYRKVDEKDMPDDGLLR